MATTDIEVHLARMSVIQGHTDSTQPSRNFVKVPQGAVSSIASYLCPEAGRFGYLYFQPVGRKVRSGQRLSNERGNAGTLELDWREVDRHCGVAWPPRAL